MDNVFNTWNNELIFSIFYDDLAKRILSILLSDSRSKDILLWKFEGSGDYSVRSGYRVLVSDFLQRNNYIKPNLVVYKDFYNTFWPIHIPTEIKIHLWRLLNNFLPHFCNLAIRSLWVDLICPLCKKTPEDTDHLLWSCEVLRSDGCLSIFELLFLIVA